jgi:hypothetical protein
LGEISLIDTTRECVKFNKHNPEKEDVALHRCCWAVVVVVVVAVEVVEVEVGAGREAR